MTFATLKTSIRSRLTRSKRKPQSDSPAYPLGMSSDQLAHLRSLAQTPAFQRYQDSLAALYETQAAPMFSGLPHDAYLFQSGVCYALEQAHRLIETVDQHAREIDEHRRSAAADRQRTDQQRVNAHFGSPWFAEWERRKSSP